MAHMERSSKLMDGIVAGIPKKQHRPIADGIISGCREDMNRKLMPDLHSVKPSATQSSEGVFGAGRTPQGVGNGKGGGAPKKESVRHEAENNNQRDDEVDSGTKKGMMRKTARRAYEKE